MKLFRDHPFMLLAVFTVMVGGLYHASGIDRNTPVGSVLYGATYALGFIFINATRFANALTENRAVAGVISLALGILPYLLGDILLRRRRAARAARGAKSV